MPDISKEHLPDRRYPEFLEKAGKWEGFWGLYHNGWLHHTRNGPTFCPIFANREDAQNWGTSIQTHHVPVPITLVDAIEHLLPDWQANDVMAGVSPTPDLAPALIAADLLAQDLLRALTAALQANLGNNP